MFVSCDTYNSSYFGNPKYETFLLICCELKQDPAQHRLLISPLVDWIYGSDADRSPLLATTKNNDSVHFESSVLNLANFG